MTSRDFCYWLQGYFELRASDGVDVEPTPEMLEMIRKHLALVFAHEIDPSAGPPAHQAKLDEIHEGHPVKPTPAATTSGGWSGPVGPGPGAASGLRFRC